MTRSVLLACVLSLGCSEGGTAAIDIRLVQDPDLNSGDQVMARIRALHVVVDSDEGLYDAADERDRGAVRILNLDQDPPRELWAIFPAEGDDVPSIRLEKGGLPNVALDIRVTGGTNDDLMGTVLAEGRARGVRVPSNGPKTLTLPFNLRPEWLPLRVVNVWPADGEGLPQCALPFVVVLFSKPVDGTTLRTNTVRLEPVGVNRIELDDTRRIATIEPARRDVFDYTLSISTEVVDDRGEPLDQVPSQSGAQAFEESFSLECRSEVVGPWCGESPTGFCPGGGSLQCVEGACLPRTCQGSPCVRGFVCDPSTADCVVDCRAYPADVICTDERNRCSETTGICE